MGSEFAEHSWLLMSIIALSYYLSASTNALWNVAIGMGLSKLQAVFSVILTIVSLAALYPMTVKWGIQGICSRRSLGVDRCADDILLHE